MLQQDAATRHLSRIFQFSMYGLLAFSGLVLAAAEGAWIPVGTAVAAVLGLWLTEQPFRWGIGPALYPVAGLLAIAFASWEFFSDNPEGKLLSGAHLVCYATWIVLLQEKKIRQYWSLFALGLLHVAVAAVLTKDTWYGLALLTFVVASIWTLAVFSLVVLDQQFRRPVLAVAAGPPGDIWRNSTPEVFNGLRYDDRGRWITGRFVGGVGVLACLALACSAVFFMLIPRVWFNSGFQFSDMNGDNRGFQNQPLTGFSREVKLGELGQILESVDPVLSIRLTDTATKEAIGVAAHAARLGMEEPMFRMGVLTTYADGKWSSDGRVDSSEIVPSTVFEGSIQQDCVLEPIGTRMLPHLGRAIACTVEGLRASPEKGARFWATNLLERDRGDVPNRRLSYIVYSTRPGSRNHRDGLEISRIVNNQYLRLNYLAINTRVSGNLTALRDFTQARIAAAEARRGRPLTKPEIADMLLKLLRDSGEYGYTLNLSVTDATIDPVEDFLFNRKEGHCEYFATALAMMLRSAGIPARLVNGFKGGEQASPDVPFYVQQRHAHAWVEAKVTPDRWTTLDPTPGLERESSVQAVSDRQGVVARIRGQLGHAWTDYVLNINYSQQQNSFYEPVRASVQAIGDRLNRAWTSLAALWKEWQSWAAQPRNWFSVTGLITAFVVMCVLSAVTWLIRWAWIRLRRLALSQRGRSQQLQQLVRFYHQFTETLRQQAGVERRAGETPREFAESLSQRLSPTMPREAVVVLSARVTDLFYRVRYGADVLDDEELLAAEGLVVQLRELLGGEKTATS